MSAKLLAFLIISCFGSCLAYKPVYIIHGIWANVSSVSTLVNTIKQHHPSTEVYTAAQCENKATLTRSMENQTLTIGEELIQISNSHPEGIHLIGYSQGGLVARGILEQFPTHRVQNFISLSSPQAGEYGDKLLHKAFPHAAEFLKKVADLAFYGKGVFRGTSVAGYWNDPHCHTKYLEGCSFLPYLNNEKSHNSSDSYKNGFAKLKKIILIGGSDDEVIEPWQSSHFDFYDENEKVVPFKERQIYKEDLFGLRTLDERGAIEVVSVSGVKHADWPNNLDVIQQHILRWLD